MPIPPKNKPFDDREDLQELVLHFGRTVKPRLWSGVMAQSGIVIDRPSASILLMLHKQPDSLCYPHQLADKMGVEAPFISRKIQELEESGLINRKIDASDRRSFQISLTPAGIEVTSRLQSAMHASMTEILNSWSKADRLALIRLLKQLIEDTESFEQRSKQTVIQKERK